MALNEWRDCGRCVALFTLENSVRMTVDRMICIHLRISQNRYRRGLLLPEELRAIEEFKEQNRTALRDRLHIFQPPRGQRTAYAIVQQAQIVGAQSLLVDQLTFMEHPDPGRKERTYVVRDIMHDLKTLISATSQPMPCALAHQINREGVQASKKADRLEMWHLAESAEVERTADRVFGLFANDGEVLANMVRLQGLADRRNTLKTWMVEANMDLGKFKVARELKAA
jgi:replicative DNA helicase